MSSKGDFLAGAVVGAIIGAAVGILFAPASGAETRGRIRERVGDVAEEVRDRAAAVSARAKERIEEFGSQVRSRFSGQGQDSDTIEETG